MSQEPVGAVDQPIQDFSDCHVGIVGTLRELTALSRPSSPTPQRSASAQRILAFFQDVVAAHHTEEEKDLFPAVLADATAGDEQAKVSGLVRQLVDEHRRLEALYANLLPALSAIARGQDVCLDPATSTALVTDYLAHAGFEEAQFLPLAQGILGRNSNHMAALGLSLHIRHASQEIRHKFGFI
jgi:hemerythrin-like domain-containing protein